ncbi:MAG: ribosome assembly factor SBDS [Candidatus Diapherotrites archaeon]|nr:ribosome assembly factor SBDS [Candidatus Diapherotrites archaeon]
MISLDDAVIARLTTHGHHFEILVDPEMAAEAKEKDLPVRDWVASDEVYRDASKAEKASEEALKESFGTTDFDKVAKRIIAKGEIQMTTEQRKELIKAKKKQIINAIAQNAIDPRSNTPHPPARIEKAMDEAKVHIDPVKATSRQVDEVVEKLRPVLPIKFALVRVEIRVPPQYTGKVYGLLHDLKRVKEEWKNDGSLVAVVEMPAGMQSAVYDKLNSSTHGSVETKLIETI